MLREMLQAVPYVIASQMRRHLNLPVLMLQGAALLVIAGPDAVALALPLLMLREAYQPLTGPIPTRLRGALVLSFSGLVGWRRACL